MKTLFLIPARGGSKALPGKNIKELHGKPLIYHTIDAARIVARDNDICVSTDSVEIQNKVEEYGLPVPFVRPANLATDSTSMEEVILHTLDFYENEKSTRYDLLALLQPTSPLRTSEHIREALSMVDDSTEMLVSVKVTDSNPYYVLFEEDESGNLVKSRQGTFKTRQECPIVYELNGAIYIININSFRKKSLSQLKMKKYVMGKHVSVDIDDWIDFRFAEFMLSYIKNHSL